MPADRDHDRDRDRDHDRAPDRAGAGPVDPYAVFRPTRARAVALVVAVTGLVVFGGLAVALPGSGTAWTWLASGLLLGFLLLLELAMWRYAGLRAVPSEQGLQVRNLLLSTTVGWHRVERVRFGGGDPWVVLTLDDGDELAVMAVQKADGEPARRAASRLAALVEAGRRDR